MATGDILIFNYSNYVMIYYQKQRGRDVGVDGEVEFIINRCVEIRSERGVVGIPPSHHKRASSCLGPALPVGTGRGAPSTSEQGSGTRSPSP